MSNKPTPHPHAELIKAWAANSSLPIQCKGRDGKWYDEPYPIWNIDSEYRIKPEENEPWKPKEGERFYFIGMTGCVYGRCWGNSETDNDFYDFHNCFCSLEEAKAAVPRVKAALKGETAEKSSVVELDGKPLTDGEKALIEALRESKIHTVFDGKSMVVYDVGHALWGKTNAVSFTPAFSRTNIVAALKQIQAEQEETK